MYCINKKMENVDEHTVLKPKFFFVSKIHKTSTENIMYSVFLR